MKKLAAALFVTLLVLPGLARAQRIYEKLGGARYESYEVHDRGVYFPVRPVGTRDTLLLWIEGVSKHEGPDRDAARAADVVVWCYPNRFPDKRHPLPAAEVVAIWFTETDGATWIHLHEASRLPDHVRNASTLSSNPRVQ